MKAGGATATARRPLRAGLSRAAGARPRPGLLAGLAAGGFSAFFLVFPTALGPRAQLACLALLLALGLAVHVWSDRQAGPTRRLFGPLTLFCLAFAFVLASRAVSLAAGDEGRYFVVDGDSGRTMTSFAARVREDEPERSIERWAPLEMGSSREPRPALSGGLERTTLDSYFGEAAIRLRFRAGSGTSQVGAELPGPFGPTSVASGRPVGTSIAVKVVTPLPPGSEVQLYTRYFSEEGTRVADRPVPQAVAAGRRAVLNPGAWQRLDGETRAPPGADSAAVLVVVRGAGSGRVRELRLDAPLAIPGERSTQGFVPRPGSGTAWTDAFARALSVTIALLGAVLVGYLLPLGRRAAARVPQVRLTSPAEPPQRVLVLALGGLGIAAYAAEMWTYGGYGGYLDSLSEIGVAGLGKWHLHTLAALPTGMAVVVAARRLALGRRAPWRPLEVAVLVAGTLIAVSYWLKAAIAIPLFTVLLFAYFSRRRTAIGLAGVAAGLALATPFVYLVRLRGRIDPSELLSADYWSEFTSTLFSRFFHFESAMVAMPHPASDTPWQPLVDFFVTFVPRALWDGKPLSASARFTDEHLLSHLYAGTDVGVISLPGELWLVGGAGAVMVVGLLLGVLLRLAHTLVATRRGEHGTVLLASGLTVGLVFVNDGWGIASAAIVLLIASAGWLLLLRPAEGRP